MTKKSSTAVTAYKGFDKNLACRGFQYEIGKTFKFDGEVVRCASGGFHSCEYPLNVFDYYAPGTSRFCEVVADGQIDRGDGGDTKLASAQITIKAEIALPDMVQRAVEWILARVETTKKEANTGNQSAATNTGYQSAATNTGNQSAATNTGNQSAATNTGDQSAATNTGNQSEAEVSGQYAVAASLGIVGRARASVGGAIVLCHRDGYSGEIKHIRASKVGDNGIKPDVWYVLDVAGEFVEAP